MGFHKDLEVELLKDMQVMEFSCIWVLNANQTKGSYDFYLELVNGNFLSSRTHQCF
jgi:hypothetical protein